MTSSGNGALEKDGLDLSVIWVWSLWDVIDTIISL